MRICRVLRVSHDPMLPAGCNLVGFPVDAATARAVANGDKAAWLSVRDKMWTACHAACFDWFGVGYDSHDTNIYLMPPDEGYPLDAAREAAGFCVLGVDVVNYCYPSEVVGWRGHTRFIPREEWPLPPMRAGGRVRITWGTLRASEAAEVTRHMTAQRAGWRPGDPPLKSTGEGQPLIANPFPFNTC